MTKKSDISHRKFKNIESPKMVSKQLKGHYLRSYEQFQKKSDFKCFFVFLFVFFFMSYPIMLPSGPSDSAFTQRGPKARVVTDGWYHFTPFNFLHFQVGILTSLRCLLQRHSDSLSTADSFLFKVRFWRSAEGPYICPPHFSQI